MHVKCYIILIFLTISIGIKHEGYNLNNQRGNIFRTFLSNYLNSLVNSCTGKQLKRYCETMHKELAEMGYKYTKNLANIFKELSTLFTALIHEEIKMYLKELDRTTDRRTEFFEALDEAFHAREILLFENYVSDLSEYCMKDKLFIKEESHKLLHEVILNAIEKLSDKNQKELRKKLKKAVKEYSDIDLREKMKMYNFPLMG